MKRAMVLLSLAVLITLAVAGTVPGKYKAGSNSGPNWFSVEASDLRLWVADTGLYGGWYQDDNKGLLFRISTSRNPDCKSNPWALHSNPTNDGGYYGNNWAGNWAAMPAGVPIAAGSTASVTYWAHWSLEQNCDGVELQIATSDDNYTTWTGLHPTGATLITPSTPPTLQLLLGHSYYTGIYGDYGIWDQQYSCDLSSYAGKTIKLRFAIYTDAQDVSTGFFVDDLAIIVNGNTVATYGFNDTGPTMWVSDQSQYWGHTVQSLWTECMLFQGEVIAGASSSYVVDYFDFDWQAFGASYGPPLHLRQTNRWTAPTGQPKFDLDTYFYAPSGSGGGRYIIADCYLKRVNDVEFGNYLYIATHMEPRVQIPFTDRSQYFPEYKMVKINYAGHNELSCFGLMYLAPGAASPYAARVTPNLPYWGNDAMLYSLMSTQQYDTAEQEGKPYVLISAGPYTTGTFPVCNTKRFTYAFVAGDSSTELFNNATNCREWYNANLADNPQSPIKVAPTSLGNIKALYK